MKQLIEEALVDLRLANPGVGRANPAQRAHRLRKVLVANRGEIAKRFFFALREEGIPSVAVVTDPDRKQSWHEFADEVVYIGDPSAYTDIPKILAAALLSGANAIYPGYGFLSENYRFVEAIDGLRENHGYDLCFLGPRAEVMRKVGDKLDARALAKAHGVPLLEGSPAIADLETAQREAERIGYPVIVKLSAGGGGKGMAVARAPSELLPICESAHRIGKANYADDTLYLERYVERPVHFEVQIFNGMAVGIRKCAVQRKNQKIIEESGDFFLDDRMILKLHAAAENVASFSGYSNGGGAGTVEFLLDAHSGQFGFLEVNTRLQVEYPVTDQSLHIDLAKWQILLFDGREDEIPYEHVRGLRFADKDHAIECRIYAEDPQNDYAPSPGIIRDLDLPTFNGVRCDVGFKAGDSVLPNYDPMIGKIIAFGRSREESLMRLERALGEVYVRGITTNVEQLLKILRHPAFRTGEYTNRLLDEAPADSVLCDGERSVRVAVLASLAELVRESHRMLDAALKQGDLESILRGGAVALIPAFHVEIQEHRLRVDFLQYGLETYAAFVNHVHVGDVQVAQRVRGSNDYTMLFGGRSWPLRVDRRATHHAVRTMEHDGVHYYRLLVHAVGSSRQIDPPGAVRCPFQGAFVKLGEAMDGRAICVGAQVGRGDPLVVIEAMKMESTITSPVTGKVTYVVEDGDLARLVRGTTSQGLVLGKALAEGELLVVVQEDVAIPTASFEFDAIPIDAAEDPLLAGLEDPTLSDGGLTAAVTDSPRDALARLLNLIRGYYLGYVQGEEVAPRLSRCLELLGTSTICFDDAEDAVVQILETYSALKQIYSSAMGANQTWFGEMNRLVREWENETYSPPALFRSVMNSLRQKYGIPRLDGKRSPEMQIALFHLFRGYSAVHEGRPLIARLLEALIARAFVPRRSRTALLDLVRLEESESDDSIAVLGRALLAQPAYSTRSQRAFDWADREVQKSRAGRFHGVEDRAFLELASAALSSTPTLTAELALPQWVREELATHTEAWSLRHHVDRLPSPLPTIVQFRLTPHDGGAHRYATIAWLEEGVPVTETDARGRISFAPNVERAAMQAGRLLTSYNDIAAGERNLVEILACEHPIDIDLAGRDPGVLNYDSLLRIAARPLRFFLHARAESVLVHLTARRPGTAQTQRQVFNVFLRHGRVCLDLLHIENAQNPLSRGISNVRDQRLFDLGKWPLECWIQECFDPGTSREIVLESIDAQPAADGTGKRQPVGAKIFEGLIAGNPAVFFFKDSRVSGGATGDLEGRKYVAACYYAFMRDVPFYVWNDGAGANVRQGMVALNRAAEGFMMNALVGHGVDYARFLKTVRSVEDPVLQSLLDEVDRAADFRPDRIGRPRNFVSIAVGVGSATGLDVYGSSQACIQIMLDAEQSYRVLTGSGVIRAVTGESFTNYEIGGARTMGQWTGTVDMIARDRIELLRHVRRIHSLFSAKRHLPAIARCDGYDVAKMDDGFADTILTESHIAANVDSHSFVTFKGEYVEAAAMVGGFARLGGKPVLIMGPRSDAGVRSFASLVRTKELLRIAAKTRSPSILVFGRRWFRAVEDEDATTTRAQIDLARQLALPSAPRIHIITRIEGLRMVTLNSQADATIYVSQPCDTERQRSFASHTATFQVQTLSEAFDLANKLLGYFEQRDDHTCLVPAAGSPKVPVDPTQPFDMVADVIDSLFDEGSFLEFHRDNDKRGGSTLVTGLATLAGKVMAVIADQPKNGGGPDAPGTEKFRMFMEFVERNQFPLVMLSNAPGFVPGTKQERLRIQQIGGESLDVNALSTVPVVSVVLNQNFGGRQIHAFSRFLRPGVVYIGLERSILAVMGASAAFDLFHGAKYRELEAQGSKSDAEKMRSEFLTAFNRKALAGADATSTGALDWTVATVGDLRDNIAAAIKLATVKAASLTACDGLMGHHVDMSAIAPAIS